MSVSTMNDADFLSEMVVNFMFVCYKIIFLKLIFTDFNRFDTIFWLCIRIEFV